MAVGQNQDVAYFSKSFVINSYVFVNNLLCSLVNLLNRLKRAKISESAASDK